MTDRERAEAEAIEKAASLAAKVADRMTAHSLLEQTRPTVNEKALAAYQHAAKVALVIARDIRALAALDAGKGTR